MFFVFGVDYFKAKKCVFYDITTFDNMSDRFRNSTFYRDMNAQKGQKTEEINSASTTCLREIVNI